MPLVQILGPDGSTITAHVRVASTWCTVCKKRKASRECDWKVAKRKSGTCDKKLCDRCSYVPAPDKDLCPIHRAAWLLHPKSKSQMAPIPAVPST